MTMFSTLKLRSCDTSVFSIRANFINNMFCPIHILHSTSYRRDKGNRSTELLVSGVRSRISRSTQPTQNEMSSYLIHDRNFILLWNYNPIHVLAHRVFNASSQASDSKSSIRLHNWLHSFEFVKQRIQIHCHPTLTRDRSEKQQLLQFSDALIITNRLWTRESPNESTTICVHCWFTSSVCRIFVEQFMSKHQNIILTYISVSSFVVRPPMSRLFRGQSFQKQ